MFWYCEIQDGGYEAEKVKANSFEDAVEAGKHIWNALSKHDKLRRDEAFVCEADSDDDGLIDLETIKEYHDLIYQD